MENCGFTGTRYGMTFDQIIKVDEFLLNNENFDIFHHGDCVGADAESHRLAQTNGLAIVVHPPTDPKFRAYCKGMFVKIRDPKPYHDRNRDIVNESDFLLATPRTFIEEKKGGTWYTIRYAKEVEKPGMIIWPDGSSEEF